MVDSMSATVLLSGGIDSATCVGYYQDLGYQVQGLYIDYGQPAGPIELEHARSVAAHYKIPLKTCKFAGSSTFGAGEVLGRNGFFIFAALMNDHGINGLLSIGIHAGTDYYDCSPDFLSGMTSLVSSYTDDRVILDAPLIALRKSDVFTMANDLGIPLKLTYSCELGSLEPCGVCQSCRDRNTLMSTVLQVTREHDHGR